MKKIKLSYFSFIFFFITACSNSTPKRDHWEDHSDYEAWCKHHYYYSADRNMKRKEGESYLNFYELIDKRCYEEADEYFKVKPYFGLNKTDQFKK